MEVSIKYFAILLILIETQCVLSQIPTCAIYDFNDPSTLNEFQDCSALQGMSGTRPLIIEPYDDSSFSPFRLDSQYYLTTNKSVNSDITQCLSTKTLFRGNFSTLSFQIGINLRNNNQTIDAYNNVQVFVSNILAFQINPGTNDYWQLYERNFSAYDFGTFDDSIIGLKVRIGNYSDLAIEFIKFYDFQLTDADCVPTSPELTTQITTDFPETETPTAETETPTAETDTTPTSTTEITPEIEVPTCLEVDFNKTTSLTDTSQECVGKYLPGLIIKSYLDTTVTPYRETSLFYLSNKWEGISCLETTSVFSLIEPSFVESVIFLNGVWPGAWIEISIIDVRTGEQEIVRKLLPENNWIRLNEEIKGNFSNAQIVITTNMNAYSQLAVEYLNIRS